MEKFMGANAADAIINIEFDFIDLVPFFKLDLGYTSYLLESLSSHNY